LCCLKLILSRSRIGCACAGEVLYPPCGRLGPRWQTNLQLLLVRTGCARIWVDDRPPVTVPADWVGLLLPGHRERFAFADRASTRHAWVEFRVDDWPGALLERLAAVPAALPTSSALARLVADAIAVAATPLSTTQPLLAAISMAAIWRYVGEAESRVHGSDDAVERARRFLHEHVGDPGVGLRQVAEAAHVSASHLVRRFRGELGVTPMAYLWDLRVATGIDLLTSTGLPVGDVAARSGFASAYHFSRRIKARTGVSPTEVRRERWSGGGDDRRSGEPPAPP
jgi:AraC-like DNA-binding protein